jgi:hypothetical protein
MFGLRHNRIWMLLALLVGGCSNPSQTTRTSGQVPVVFPPSLSVADAGVIATNLTRDMKINLKDYEQPEVTFNSASRKWVFIFWHKPPVGPTGHFLITVDEAGKTRFFAGY